jgi:hypothetical protein
MTGDPRTARVYREVTRALAMARGGEVARAIALLHRLRVENPEHATGLDHVLMLLYTLSMDADGYLQLASDAPTPDNLFLGATAALSKGDVALCGRLLDRLDSAIQWGPYDSLRFASKRLRDRLRRKMQPPS